MTGQQTQFGGYFDIILDFSVYSLIPIGIAAPHDDKPTFLILALMEGLFFVNAGSLFQLSAILEQKNQGAKMRGELTTVTMPSALIEGFETMIFFSLFMLVPFQLVKYLYLIFSTGVFINVIYRLQWAYRNLSPPKKVQ